LLVRAVLAVDFMCCGRWGAAIQCGGKRSTQEMMMMSTSLCS